MSGCGKIPVGIGKRKKQTNWKRGLSMMNTYAKKVIDYLDEEKIFYSCEEIGEGDENLIIYAMSDGAPNIWAEIEESGELQLTAYLSHDIGEEKKKELQEKNYKIETAYAEFQLYTDEEGSVTALYNTILDWKDAGESFAKAMYTFLYSMNQCIEDILVYVKQG